MADVVSPDVRSRMMSGIRGKNTKPEIIVRKGLHKAGFRFRIHVALPGKPDMVFPKRKAVLFVNGCFWHGHGCHLFRWPQSREDFWRSKISENIARDLMAVEKLNKEGWRVGIVWECALKGKTRLAPNLVIKLCSSWLKSRRKFIEVAGAHETRSLISIL